MRQAGLPFEEGHEGLALVFSRHPRARRYVLRVRPDGAIAVTLPRWGSKREARAFAESQQRWIEKELQRHAAERARPRPAAPAPAELRALRRRAVAELPERLAALAARFGLAVSRVSVRDQRTRWGSCSRRGHICLNWRLVLMPDWIAEYVMVHELMHLKRMDHSMRFWRLVASACPRYQEARQWLREHDPILHPAL